MNPQCFWWDEDRYTNYTFNCSEFGMEYGRDYNWYCEINYQHKPCDMSDNNCSLEFYDWNWNWISYDCLNDMSNSTKWRNEISNATVWRNNTANNEMAWIWSYWEDQYI